MARKKKLLSVFRIGAGCGRKAAKGDHDAVQSRLYILQELPVLEIEQECVEIADIFFSRASLPEKARDDALHVAIATYYKIDFLLTWNCRHLANPNKFGHIGSVNSALGLSVPLLTTPLNYLSEANADG